MRTRNGKQLWLAPSSHYPGERLALGPFATDSVKYLN